MPFSDMKLFACIYQKKAGIVVTGDADLPKLKNFRGATIFTKRETGISGRLVVSGCFGSSALIVARFP